MKTYLIRGYYHHGNFSCIEKIENGKHLLVGSFNSKEKNYTQNDEFTFLKHIEDVDLTNK